MTEQDPRDEPGTTPALHRAAEPAVEAPAALPRHRRSGAATVTSWLAVLQRPDRRGLLIVGAVLVSLLLLAVGYVALIARDLGNQRPPSAAGTPSPTGPVPTGSTPTGSAPAGTGPSSAPASSAVPSGTPSASPGASDPAIPGASATPPPGDGGNERRPESGRTPPAAKSAPRLVGPATFDGFTALLSGFCRDRGQRTAVLLNGPGDNPKTGNWACTKVTTLFEINLDEACRQKFGAESQARRTARRDSRTWRCFDR